MPKTMKRPQLFKTEADLCAAFIAWAEKFGARCYAEWCGWDILVVLPQGEQIGIQAKLTLSDHVMIQALQFADARDHIGPDFRAILVPSAPDSRDVIAYRLGLLTFTPTMEYEARRLTEPRAFRGNFGPPIQFQNHEWTDWNPAERHSLPDTPTDSVAGSPSPITLTPWKLRALSVVAEIHIMGRIHSKRMKELGVNPSRWTQGRWLEPQGERGFWIIGEKCPPFDKQHPSAFEAEVSRRRALAAEVKA